MASCNPEHLKHLHSVTEYVQGVCTCIEAAKDVREVEALLQRMKVLLFPVDPSLPDPTLATQHAAAGGMGAVPLGLPLADASLASKSTASDVEKRADEVLESRAAAVQQDAVCFADPIAASWRAFCGAPFSAFAGCLLSGSCTCQRLWVTFLI